MSDHKFPYNWNLSDGYPAKGIKAHGCKVFGTFICGGGSSMGYKLAGFNHLGGVEIDPPIADVYKANHAPKYLYVEDIREFNKRKNLPNELFDLDLLDGSPPCSSFSMAGNREKDWGKSKVFREGQALQTLDDLFFDYIALAKRLQPKVVLAENVKGLIQGNAKAYVRKIKAAFEDAGYVVQLFLLNAASMGVPQKRERVFFVCQRKDLGLGKLKMGFKEEAIVFGDIRLPGHKAQAWTEYDQFIWDQKIDADGDYGQVNMRLKGSPSSFNAKFVKDNKVCNTITSTSGSKLVSFSEPKMLGEKEIMMCGSYPLDYNFKHTDPKYLIGMSVPPVMTAQIAHQIYLQWLSKIKD